jgi:hypothetical protein
LLQIALSVKRFHGKFAFWLESVFLEGVLKVPVSNLDIDEMMEQKEAHCLIFSSVNLG